MYARECKKSHQYFIKIHKVNFGNFKESRFMWHSLSKSINHLFILVGWWSTDYGVGLVPR